MTALDNIPDADLKRFAACYQNSTDKNTIDWDAAANMYDTKVQVASFKTVTSRATKAASDTLATAADIKRFAICYINFKDQNAVDWNSATATYDPKGQIKPASFRTVTQRALRKHGFAPAATQKRKAKTSSENTTNEDGNEDGKEGADEQIPKAKKPRKSLKSLQDKEMEDTIAKPIAKTKAKQATASPTTGSGLEDDVFGVDVGAMNEPIIKKTREINRVLTYEDDNNNGDVF